MVLIELYYLGYGSYLITLFGHHRDYNYLKSKNQPFSVWLTHLNLVNFIS